MLGGNVARNEMMRYSAGMDMMSSHRRMMTVSVAPAKLTGDAANHHAEGERQQNADDADGKRDLRTIKQARENIAAKLVGAKKDRWIEAGMQPNNLYLSPWTKK